ncbi:hypothetical protein NPX13_g6721 [Xylaria arbuscula]|uniref:Uncharacterized protein n=1 Tax=Xylaria arbuscula TaxID=114810 RepID=A0A9W8TL51_9PEZI|nr:hypothetical protein NPX13_g6721 [Xylaria arbuscula]
MYLDQQALDLLRSQSKMLYELSSTMETWQQGKYGRYLSFCDCATLADVRKMWAFYGVERKGAESARFQSVLDKAKANRQNFVNPGRSSINLTGLRSASPAHLSCLQDLNTLNQHYWKHGITELKADIRSAATHSNPAFLTLGDGAVVHYGTDPLLGFHFAAVDAPLDSTDATVNRLPWREKYAALARAEFREWVVSYRERFPKNDVRVRFFIGDAVSFAHTLQRKRETSEITAHWYRDRYGVRPLVLDGPEYAPGARAPVQFDVIDTSNLCDHLGSLTLLTATSPLLPDVSAVLYTEALARNHKSYREVLDQVLCGHVPTLSTLLGLFPIEYWTNTSPMSIGDEMMLDTLMGGLSKNQKTSRQGGQMFLRTSWKRALCISSTITPLPQSIPIRFEPKLFAKTLYGVYVRMFLDEYWAHRLSNLDLEALRKSALDTVMEATMDLIEGRSNAPMGMNYYQELNVYLHMLGVFSTGVMKGWTKRNEDPILTPFLSSIRPVDGKWGDLRDWKNIPPVVCVTLRIPRNKLTVFTNMDLNKLVALGVHNSPTTVACFLPKLGLTLNVHETTLNDLDAVHVTRFAPNQKGFPIVTGFTRTALANDIGTRAESSLIAAVDQKTGAITSLIGQLDIMSSDLKQALTSRCEIKKSIVSPCKVTISLGQNPPLGLCFPIFIKQSSQKLRIARRSSHVEVVIQVAECSEWITYPDYIVPVRPLPGKPVNCNMPYLNLQKCPIIQIMQHSRLKWLVPHLSLAMSARERALREREDLPRSIGENVRLDFKESIFSIFVQFAGLQGTKSQVFCLNNAAHGGVHVIILASALRLDLANRAVVLDCAVLPLYDALMPDITGSLAKLQGFGVVVVQVNDAELQLWRHALPVYVERCRDWTHRDNCEYAISSSIPLNKGNRKRVLCSCGNGKFPPNFISNVLGWIGLSKYAVRATISPAFWAPFAEDMYSPDQGNLGKKKVANVEKTSVDSGCASCGKNKQADGGGLLNCARCMKVNYGEHYNTTATKARARWPAGYGRADPLCSPPKPITPPSTRALMDGKEPFNTVTIT